MGKELLERDSGAKDPKRTQNPGGSDFAAAARKLEQGQMPPGQLPPGIKPYDAARYTSQDQVVKSVDGDVYRMIKGGRVQVQVGDVVKPGQNLFSNDGANMVLFDPVHGEWKPVITPDTLLQISAYGPPIRKQKTQVMVREGSVKGGLAALDAASETKDAGKGHETPPK